MKALPFVVLALLVVGGAIVFFILRNPTQKASVSVGTPTVTHTPGIAPGPLPF